MQATPIFLLFNEQKGGSFEPKEPPPPRAPLPVSMDHWYGKTVKCFCVLYTYLTVNILCTTHSCGVSLGEKLAIGFGASPQGMKPW